MSEKIRALTPFGQAIKMKLAEKDMLVKELAEEVGTSSRYMSDIIRGRKPGYKYRGRILEVLGLEGFYGHNYEEDFTVENNESDIKIGDKVIMNTKYYVSKRYKDVVFTVRSNPFDISGTTCVMLENYRGGYALDGLTKVE